MKGNGCAATFTAYQPNQSAAVDVLARSQSRDRVKRRHGLAGPLGLEQIGKQERKIDRLLGIQPRIADSVVAVVEVLIGDLSNAAGALGDILAGHFEMHAASIDAL